MIYDITYRKQVNDLAPPHKRKPKVLALLNALVYPIQWARDVFFLIYKLGSNESTYLSGSTYVQGERVVGTDKAVYEALQDVPTSRPPVSHPEYWQKICENFMGADQRVLGTSQIIILQGDGPSPTYSPSGRANQNGLLNKWFGISSAPWIYIQNNDVLISDIFFFGRSEYFSSTFSKTDNSIFVNAGLPLDYSGPPTLTADFTIKFPSSEYDALGANKEKIVRRFVDQYVLAGITYDIVGY